MAISKIVSGGQTGADRGALDAAIGAGIRHGGYCPKGRLAEDGEIPEEYLLTEMNSTSYEARTEANVVDSDATLILTHGAASGGSLKTIEFAVKYERPWHHIDLNVGTHHRQVEEIVDWIEGRSDAGSPSQAIPEPVVLNVAGSRGSSDPTLEDVTMHVLWDVLRRTNPECAHLYPLYRDMSSIPHIN